METSIDNQTPSGVVGGVRLPGTTVPAAAATSTANGPAQAAAATAAGPTSPERAPTPERAASPEAAADGPAATPEAGSEAEVEAEVEATPEQQAAVATHGRIRDLLGAYQQTLDRVERLPAVVWMPWAATGPGRHLKVPYVRLFLRFFVSHHINRNLTALNRRLQSMAALAEDADDTKPSREMVRYFQQSLPAPPYRTLIFAVIAAALVIALPLQAVGNVFYVLDLVGALLRLDVGYAGRAFASKELGPTIRSLFVLLVGLVVVAGVLTSPFELKRALFNLYPWHEEDFVRTGARSHGHRTEGIYALEAKLFDDVGARQPPEGRWDLGFQTSLLAMLLVLESLLVLLTISFALRLPFTINIDLPIEGPNYDLSAPSLPAWSYGLLAAALLVCCLLLVWRVGHAWKMRRRPRRLDVSDRRAAPPA